MVNTLTVPATIVIPDRTRGASAQPSNEMKNAMISVRIAPRGDAAFNQFSIDAPQATVYHRPEWLNAMEDAFGVRGHRLVAEQAGQVAGILPLGHVRSFLFGNFLTSVPFGNFGGIVASTPAANQPLLDEAVRLARELGCKWIEFRHIDAVDLPLAVHTRKVRQIVPFTKDPQELFNGFRKEVRKKIRNAEKCELSCEFVGREGLDDFYTVFARNMRDHGTPVYSRRFFDVLWDHMGEFLKVVTVRHQGLAVASLVLLEFRKQQLESPWASSLKEYNTMCPNNLMFWKVFEWACQNGYERYDFGTSDAGGGVYTFKQNWGATETTLHRQYWLAPGQEMPHLNPSNPKYQRKIEMWRKLPMWAANTLGPILARKLP